MTAGPRGERALFLLCLAAGALFFTSLGELWPLAAVDLVVPARELRAQARSFLEAQGHDLTGYRSASLLLVQADTLDYVERSFGRSRAERWIAEGLPLVYYRVDFKKRGESVWYTVALHPAAGVLGWTKWIDEDYPGARISADEARLAAREALRRGLDLDADAFEERSATATEQPERRTHVFGFERWVAHEPELRERVTITIAGAQVTGAARRLLVPDAARRAVRAAEAPAAALEIVGYAVLAAFAVAAFFIFLARLRDGAVDIGRVARWPAIVFACSLGTAALGTAELFAHWEPLWPRWISSLRELVFGAIEQSWLLLVLLAVVAAGDALDRDLRAGRGEALWALGRARLLDARVDRASGRGFLIGLLCGGVMAAAVLALEALGGARTSIQPRGFFFYTLNSAAPAATSLLFFLGVALVEELGYRFFAGGLLLARTGSKALAILLPAVAYGLTHATLSFLPPAEPFWTRPLVMTAVGCVWGWAFFRYDALTVVLSHFTADLFIFNWPRLASGRPGLILASLATMAVPLVPALLGAGARRLDRSSGP